VLLGILVLSLAVVITVAGLILVRCLTSLSIGQEQNDVAGFIYAVVSIAYAVLLAFLVIAV
jgi:hypothetical protein